MDTSSERVCKDLYMFLHSPEITTNPGPRKILACGFSGFKPVQGSVYSYIFLGYLYFPFLLNTEVQMCRFPCSLFLRTTLSTLKVQLFGVLAFQRALTTLGGKLGFLSCLSPCLVVKQELKTHQCLAGLLLYDLNSLCISLLSQL